MLSPTERFSSRVADYVKYRPGYPPEVMATLQSECGLAPGHVIADIGSGTGILTSLLLSQGNKVIAIEPNTPMRAAGEALLEHNPGFSSVDGSAEATTLPDGSVDFVAAGQAFHWFEPVTTRREFVRILRPGGWVVLVWNRRQTVLSPFQDAYENLLRTHAPEYPQVTNERIDDVALAEFFAPVAYTVRYFPNAQELDLNALRGRMLSSSYVPLPGQNGHDALVAGLGEIFELFNKNGLVRFEYDTQVVFGRLGVG